MESTPQWHPCRLCLVTHARTFANSPATTLFSGSLLAFPVPSLPGISPSHYRLLPWRICKEVPFVANKPYLHIRPQTHLDSHPWLPGFSDPVYSLLITDPGWRTSFCLSDLLTPWLGLGLGWGLDWFWAPPPGPRLVGADDCFGIWSDALPPDFCLDRSCPCELTSTNASLPPTVLTSPQSPVLDLGDFGVAGFPLPFW